MTDHTLDRLSLSLPDWRSALRKRAKRPRRPSPWEIVWLVMMVWNFVDATADAAVGDWPHLPFAAAVTVVMWHVYRAERRNDQMRVMLLLLQAMGLAILGWVVG